VTSLDLPSTSYRGLVLRVLTRGQPALGPGKAELLALIEATGSISSAAREMGMSYKRAWQLVEAMNAGFREPLVLKAAGGKAGGGAALSDAGRHVVLLYRRMEASARAAIERDLRALEALVREPVR
jgi:molybdate transport system regulatory protein